jgi:ABC-type branched-subunit amino acid transport system ATPase component
MLLELDNVSLSYGRIQALHGISLTVGEGEVVALIGANGAGKSTTMRAIPSLVILKRFIPASLVPSKRISPEVTW